MAQQEGDRDQPWVLARGQTRGGTDEPIELVGDVEFFEEDVEEPTSPGDAVRAVRQFSKNRVAVAFAPVLHLDAVRRPGV